MYPGACQTNMWLHSLELSPPTRLHPEYCVCVLLNSKHVNTFVCLQGLVEELCDFHWSTCFHLAMANETHRNKICKLGCHDDCEGMTYDYELSSDKLEESILYVR